MSEKVSYVSDSTYYTPRFKEYDIGRSGNPYLPMSSMYLDFAQTSPVSLWGANLAISNSNYYSLVQGMPYSSVHRYYGSGPYYNVMDAACYSYNTGMHSNPMNFNSQLSNCAASASVNLYANQITSYISKINGMAGWTKAELLSEGSREQAQQIVDNCKKYSDLLNKYMKNQQGLSATTLNSVLASLLEQIKAFDEEVRALDEQLREELNAAEEAKAAGLESSSESSGSGGGSGAGTSVATQEGDTKMNSAQLSNRYEVKAPIVSEFTCSQAADIINAADSREKFKTALTALSDKTTSAFLVALSDDEIAKLCENIDGQSWFGDDDETSMKEFLAKFDSALSSLKNSKYLTQDEYDKACELIANSKKEVYDSFRDDACDKIICNLKELKKILQTTVDGYTVAKGSQKHFDGLIKTKQEEFSSNAIKDFRKDYASSTKNDETPQTFDENAIYKELPDEVTYLPNKNSFQVKLEGKVFVGKDFGEINRKILKCRDESIIMAWVDLKKEILLVKN